MCESLSCMAECVYHHYQSLLHVALRNWFSTCISLCKVAQSILLSRRGTERKILIPHARDDYVIMHTYKRLIKRLYVARGYLFSISLSGYSCTGAHRRPWCEPWCPSDTLTIRPGTRNLPPIIKKRQVLHSRRNKDVDLTQTSTPAFISKSWTVPENLCIPGTRVT